MNIKRNIILVQNPDSILKGDKYLMDDRKQTADMIINVIHELLCRNNFSIGFSKNQKFLLIDHETNKKYVIEK
jgi:hypothetical protein